MLDELQIHQIPVLFGAGRQLKLYPSPGRGVLGPGRQGEREQPKLGAERGRPEIT